jgi:hypothetical protein
MYCLLWNVAFAVVLSLARHVEESHILYIYLIIIDWCTDSSAANTLDVPGDMKETRDFLPSLQCSSIGDSSMTRPYV